jgi:holo-[acyl-carrier protein] synthase
MIVGVGIDLVAIDRVGALLADHGERFLARCFRPAEQELAAARGAGATALLAAHWAAREAFLKALGTDVRRLPYRDVEVVRPRDGPARLRLHGRAREAFAARGGRSSHLSLADAGGHAVAVVVIEG